MPAYPQAASIQQGGTIVKVGAISPRNYNTLSRTPTLSSDGTDVTGSTTAMLTAEILVGLPCWSTGAAPFNGSVAAGNTRIALYNSSGVLIASTAATAQSGTDAYQLIPWASEYVSVPGTKTALVGRLYLPAGTYYLGVTTSSASSKFNCVLFGGTAGASSITIVAATALETTSLTINPPTTFTASVGPYASLY